MKHKQIALGTLVGGLLLTVAAASADPIASNAAVPGIRPGDESATQATPIVVGTFDSRGLAMAYVRSKAFQAYLDAQKGDVERLLERARTEGDDQLVASLEELGPAMQKRIHQQGFGNAPVDDILARIATELPRVAEETGVDLIVSKWQLAWMRPGAPTVDVTDDLVALFEPDEATLAGIHELLSQDPVPLDQLREDH